MTAPNSHGHKKGCKDRFYEHFKKANKDFLEAMQLESERHISHYEALLACNKEKHSMLVGQEMKKDLETMALHKYMGTTIFKALKNMSNFFRSFVGEMSKRM